MKNKLIFLIAIAILCYSQSCIKDEHESLNSIYEQTNIYEENQYNSSLQKISIAYAIALEDYSFRNLVKSEAQKRFDGDYDILHNSFKGIKFSNGSNVNDFLTSSLKSLNNDRKYDQITESFLDSLANEYPTLQISVPVHCEDWNTENHIPKVVFLPDNFNETEFSMVKAYSSDGNYTWISSIEEPDYPVVVVSKSERINAKGEFVSSNITKKNTNRNQIEQNSTIENADNAKGIPFAPTDLHTRSIESHSIHLSWKDNSSVESGYRIYRAAPYESYEAYKDLPANTQFFKDNQCSQDGKDYLYYVTVYNNYGISNPSNYSIERAGSRSSGDKLVISYIYMTSDCLRRIESWTLGAPEIMMSLAYGNNESGSYYIENEEKEPRFRNYVKDRWWNCDFILDNWWLEDRSYILTIHFWERDKDNLEANLDIELKYAKEVEIPGGAEISINAGCKLPLSYGKNDIKIGKEHISWWDPVVDEYHIGDFKFRTDTK